MEVPQVRGRSNGGLIWSVCHRDRSSMYMIVCQPWLEERVSRAPAPWAYFHRALWEY